MRKETEIKRRRRMGRKSGREDIGRGRVVGKIWEEGLGSFLNVNHMLATC